MQIWDFLTCPVTLVYPPGSGKLKIHTLVPIKALKQALEIQFKYFLEILDMED